MNADEIPLPNIRKIFQERFGSFEIELPEQDVINRTPGTLLEGSWMIKYRFGKDGEREWCEYYANTRFLWGDEHIKIYEDGEQVKLPALCSIFTYKSGNKEEARIKHQKEYEKTFKSQT
jgi:hypothetical protein